MRIRGLLVVTALVFVGAAACGDDDKKLTASEFKSQGNAICKKGNDKMDAAASKVFTDNEEPDKEVTRAFLKDTAIPNIRQQIDDVDALKPPDELADGADDLVAEARTALKKFEEAADSENPNELFEHEDPFAEANKLATKIGLTACADDGEDEEG